MCFPTASCPVGPPRHQLIFSHLPTQCAGSGKGLFVTQVGSYLGSHCKHFLNHKSLVGNFNSQLMNATFVILDELCMGGAGREASAVLKGVLTGLAATSAHGPVWGP